MLHPQPKWLILIPIVLSLSSCTTSLPWKNLSSTTDQIVVLENFQSRQFFERLITTPLNPGSPLQLGIVPHHEVAKAWIGEFWSTIALSHPDTIILLSPNHYELGESTLLTSHAAWETSLGLLQPDKFILNTLTTQTTQATEIISQDHGFTTHIPYITHFMPQVKIVPLLISNRLTETEVDVLTSDLHQLISTNSKIAVIASLDFSHYLDSLTATQKDIETKQLIQVPQTDHILRLTNNQVDSPAVLAVITRLGQLLACNQPVFFHHGNSSDFTGETSNTTSYFVIGYESGNCQLK